MAAICFIVNPASGMGRTGRHLEELRRQAADLDGEWLITERPGHATELAAAATGCEIVVAVGGDVTQLGPRSSAVTRRTYARLVRTKGQ